MDNQYSPPSRQMSGSTYGYSGVGQNQMLAGPDIVHAASASVDKGGMRALGLVTAMAAEIALKQKMNDLARDYYNLNKQDFDFFTDVQEPEIATTVSQTFDPDINPSFTPDPKASIAAGMAVSSRVERTWFEARRRIPKYNTGQARRLDFDMAIAKVQAGATGWNLGVRYEEAYSLAHNKRAWHRKVAIANVGITVGNIVRQGSGQAMAKLSSAFGGIADTVSSVGNGLASDLGYTYGAKHAAQKEGSAHGKS